MLSVKTIFLARAPLRWEQLVFVCSVVADIYLPHSGACILAPVAETQRDSQPG